MLESSIEMPSAKYIALLLLKISIITIRSALDATRDLLMPLYETFSDLPIADELEDFMSTSFESEREVITVLVADCETISGGGDATTVTKEGEVDDDVDSDVMMTFKDDEEEEVLTRSCALDFLANASALLLARCFFTFTPKASIPVAI